MGNGPVLTDSSPDSYEAPGPSYEGAPEGGPELPPNASDGREALPPAVVPSVPEGGIAPPAPDPFRRTPPAPAYQPPPVPPAGDTSPPGSIVYPGGYPAYPSQPGYPPYPVYGGGYPSYGGGYPPPGPHRGTPSPTTGLPAPRLVRHTLHRRTWMWVVVLTAVGGRAGRGAGGRSGRLGQPADHRRAVLPQPERAGQAPGHPGGAGQGGAGRGVHRQPVGGEWRLGSAGTSSRRPAPA